MIMHKTAISIGDPAGIGPEIALKAALDTRVRGAARPILVGDAGYLARHAQLAGLSPKLNAFKTIDAVDWSAEGVLVLDPGTLGGPMEIGEIAANHGRAAVEAARVAIQAGMDGKVDSVVSAPQTERSIRDAGISFDGYPGFLARCTGTPEEDVFLMHCFEGMRIVHATLHVSLRHAIELITEERKQLVKETLARLSEADRQLIRGVFLEERDRGEICDELRIERTNLRVRLHRAMAKFRTALERTAPPKTFSAGGLQ
jgi:4-hydroxythreonine-4-phosphate dehydrogenase